MIGASKAWDLVWYRSALGNSGVMQSRHVFQKTIRLTFFLASFAVYNIGIAEEQPQAKMLLSEAALRQADGPKEAYNSRDIFQQNNSYDKSYLLPAVEIPGFIFLLNRFNNLFIGSEYDVSLSSIKRNLGSSWVEDQDPFAINQLGHPYQGSMYYGFARSAGFNFWESFGYTFAGSTLWEIAGETTPPSRNDQITTSFAGTFLGESLFRMANLVLERGYGLSAPWREVAAAAISPPTGLNRSVFPERFQNVLASRNSAIFSRLQVGASGTLHSVAGGSTEFMDNEVAANYLLEYGLPGKAGYDYRRPFDYFTFEVNSSSLRGVESLHNRGLIVGTDYEIGSAYRGIWGLYGTYDYLAPQPFQLSSTALSLGTTGQWRLSNFLTLQGTGMAGIGFTATGTIRAQPERDYNYGFAPQALLALRLVAGNAASFDVTARRYFAGQLARSDSGGKDEIFRADASFTVRIHQNHAIAIKYVSSRRDSSSPDLGRRDQSRETLGIYYTLLGTN